MYDGGAITCLQGGFYGASLTITKSITIDCLSGGAGNTHSVTINAPGKIVRLRNLAVNCYGVISVAIDIVLAASVHLENVFVTGATSTGISWHPPFPSTQLVVSDSTITG